MSNVIVINDDDIHNKPVQKDENENNDIIVIEEEVEEEEEEVEIIEVPLATNKISKMDIQLRPGLVNNGNQCFMNASFQCLAVSPFIHEYFAKYDAFDIELIGIIEKYNLNTLKAYNFANVISELIEYDKNKKLNNSIKTEFISSLNSRLFPISEDDKRLLTYIASRCSSFYIYMCFKEIIKNLQSKSKPLINHQSYINVIKELSDHGGFAHLFSGEQNDPHEFMVYILDQVHAARSSQVSIDLLNGAQTDKLHVKLYIEHFKKRYENDFSMFVKNFYYYMLNCIECYKCKNITYEVSPSDILCLNLPYDWRSREDLNLEHCLNDYFKVEGIEYRCEKCGNFYDNRQDRKLLTRPKSLVIKLKRYTQITQGHNTVIAKINKMISYPQKMQLSKYLCNGDVSAYELYGIINHAGVMNGGHYYSYIRNYNTSSNKFDKDWMVCNDTQVNSISETEALNSKNAYILFYHTV